MAKASVEKVEVKPSIENLAGLKKEFLRSEMNPRKSTMLKLRLVELHTAGSIHPEELELMELIFKRERSQGKIEENHLERLCRLERDRCTDTCIVKTADAPSVHKLHKDQVCKMYIDHDNGRYVVFVDDVIPTEHQLTREIVIKQERGHPVPPEAYPPPRVIVRRLNLKKKEFDQWFEIEENLLKPIETEESYSF